MWRGDFTLILSFITCVLTLPSLAHAVPGALCQRGCLVLVHLLVTTCQAASEQRWQSGKAEKGAGVSVSCGCVAFLMTSARCTSKYNLHSCTLIIHCCYQGTNACIFLFRPLAFLNLRYCIYRQLILILLRCFIVASSCECLIFGSRPVERVVHSPTVRGSVPPRSVSLAFTVSE